MQISKTIISNEDNKKIAEFMKKDAVIIHVVITPSGEVHDIRDYLKVFHNLTSDFKGKPNGNQNGEILKYPEYQKDWNELMQVVNQIKILGNDYVIEGFNPYQMIIYINESDGIYFKGQSEYKLIDAVYDCCLKTINYLDN